MQFTRFRQLSMYAPFRQLQNLVKCIVLHVLNRRVNM